MRARRLKGILVIALGVAAGVALALRTAPQGSLHSTPSTPERALLEAFRDTPGDPVLDRLFAELNMLHFGGRLPTVKVIWTGDLDRLDAGDYRLNGMTDGTIVLLKAALHDDEAEIRRTLCHEMVHVRLIAEGKRSTAHDDVFQQELRRLLDEGCFHAIWSRPEERTALKERIDEERKRLDAARERLDAEGASITQAGEHVERTFAALNERIRIANAAGAGSPSPQEVTRAEQEQSDLNQRILDYNDRLARNAAERARFNEDVQRYNLMLAYPDGLAEDRAKGLTIR